MFRSKIIGQAPFNHAWEKANQGTNLDLGHFVIGVNDPADFGFADVPIPPKYLWIRARVIFVPCPDTPVLREANSFVWNSPDRCSQVRLEPILILSKDTYHKVEQSWNLIKTEPAFQHEFTVAPSIYPNEAVHLWPCGGSINADFTKVEQLFAQAPFEGEQIYVNSLRTWREHLEAIDSPVVFEPPAAQEQSLATAIASGKLNLYIEQSGLIAYFTSCRAEPTGILELVDILCERKDL